MHWQPAPSDGTELVPPGDSQDGSPSPSSEAHRDLRPAYSGDGEGRRWEEAAATRVAARVAHEGATRGLLLCGGSKHAHHSNEKIVQEA